MAVVVSRNPSLFLPQKGLIVSHRLHKTRLVPLSEITRGAGNLAKPVTTVLSSLLSKLSDLSISFRSIRLSLERDPEIPSWKYVVIQVELEMDPKTFSKIEDELVEHAFSSLPKRDSTKVLLVLSHV
jgi:hypothetical protein